jgi:REP element-mobilizing transposase RayT
MYRAMREVLQHFIGRKDFRVCHLSIQENHLHFLIEAANRTALSRGMQSLASRAAHALNRADGNRRSEVFTYRYHSTQITTARQARHTLAYVLNNWRKHRQDWVCEAASKAKIDPYASGISFDGWAGVTWFQVPTDYTPLPVSPPQTSLLRSDWRRYGHIGLFEIPGPLR